MTSFVFLRDALCCKCWDAFGDHTERLLSQVLPTDMLLLSRFEYQSANWKCSGSIGWISTFHVVQLFWVVVISTGILQPLLFPIHFMHNTNQNSTTILHPKHTRYHRNDHRQINQNRLVAQCRVPTMRIAYGICTSTLLILTWSLWITG